MTAPTRMRLLTYNILKGGQEREAEIVEVIQSLAPDVVVLQEVLEVNRFRQIATVLGNRGSCVATYSAPPSQGDPVPGSSAAGGSPGYVSKDNKSSDCHGCIY
jgi:hypothetical protein